MPAVADSVEDSEKVSIHSLSASCNQRKAEIRTVKQQIMHVLYPARSATKPINNRPTILAPAMVERTPAAVVAGMPMSMA